MNFIKCFEKFNYIDRIFQLNDWKSSKYPKKYTIVFINIFANPNKTTLFFK